MDTSTGGRLAVLRYEHGLSQEELAARLGVSRQAVSNWERSESFPDTGNLIGLSRLYGTTIDELVSSASAKVGASPSPSTSDLRGGPRVRRLVALIACAALSAAYYALIAPPLVRSTVNDVAEVFGLSVGSALATTWFAAETIFVLLPFVLIAAAPAPLPRWAWVVPLSSLVVPAVAIIGYSMLGGGTALGYSGIGGALMPSIALKADALALVLGCSLVHIARVDGAYLTMASTPTNRGSEVV